MINSQNPGIGKRTRIVLILGALITAASLKLWLVLSDVLPFNSDEAVVALMARHILQGEKPLFFYGQAYMGSLDAWLVAIGFWLFGQSVWVIRMIQGTLYLALMLTTYKLGTLALGSSRIGIAALWFLAIPNVIVTLYTTVSLGGYGEGLLIGSLNLIVGFQIANRLHNKDNIEPWRWLLWGLLTGLGLWVFGISLIFSASMGVYLLINLWKINPQINRFFSCRKTWKAVFSAGLGALIGAAPWWWFAIQNGFYVLINELGGSAVSVEKGSWFLRSLKHLGSLILFGSTAAFGMRPSWEIRWLAMPLLPVALAFWIGVLIFIVIRLKPGNPNREGAAVLGGSMLILSLGFIMTSFGVDPSGRYFVPLVIPLALFAGEMLVVLERRIGRWAWGLLGIIVIFHCWGTWQSANRYPPGITTQFDTVAQVDVRYLDDLIHFLNEQGETFGYTNYWVSYPLAFISEEKMIYIPRLPYHEDLGYSPRDDRYEPYSSLVESADRVAYITSHNPVLDDYLRSAFRRNEISWREHQVGDYLVFYELSDLIRPEEIGLGLNTP